MTDREPEAQDDEGLLDKLRQSPVGANDPNIVGDAGPVDTAPGQDPEGLIVHEDESEET